MNNIDVAKCRPVLKENLLKAVKGLGLQHRFTFQENTSNRKTGEQFKIKRFIFERTF